MQRVRLPERQGPPAVRVLFAIRSLDRGGAERQLVELAAGLLDRGHEVGVVVFYGGGPLQRELEDRGVRVVSLGKRGRWEILRFLWRLIRVIRREAPDVLHGYLDIPNIVVAMLRGVSPGARIVWGIRASDMDLERRDWLWRLAFRLECLLSHQADLVISNSAAGLRHRVAHGFAASRAIVIPNGIDTAQFSPRPKDGERLRHEWTISDSRVVIGLVARLDPIKDHSTFLEAAALVVRRRKDLKFVCVGDGPADYRNHLLDTGNRLGLNHVLIWSGQRSDMAAVYSAFDIACLASRAEGFPNAIAEAMACGVPCVVTDVGDSAVIVGGTGIVVPPGDPKALMLGWEELLARLASHQGSQLRGAARERVVAKFGVDILVAKTEKVLLDLVRA